MKQINIPGFTTQVAPTTRPALCVFAKPNCGTTRLGTTMPTEGGYIAYLALDQNCRQTMEEIKLARPDLPLIVNAEPFITDAEAVRIVMRLGPPTGNSDVERKSAKSAKEEEAMADYMRVMDKFREYAAALTKSEAVTSVVIDKNSQLYNWILFSRHGRAQQVQQLSRAVPNQDMIDIISMIRQKKNLLLIHRAKDVYKKTGQKDAMGNDKTEKVEGKHEPEAMGNIEGFVTATLELQSKKVLGESGRQMEDEGREEYRKRALKAKYRVKVMACKGNTLMEGLDLHKLSEEEEMKLQAESEQYEGPGVSGEDITWENIMLTLGIK